MNQRAIIVPARKQKATDPSYANATGALKRTGHEMVPFHVVWNSKLMSQWVEELRSIVASEDTPVTLCGFSLGAMICLLTATKVPVENMILCSPSGYFKEYLDEMPPIDKRTLGDLRWTEFRQLAAPEALAQVQAKHVKVLIQEGDLANKGMARWIHDLIEITGWELTKIPYGTNGINNPNYQRNVVELVKRLGEV